MKKDIKKLEDFYKKVIEAQIKNLPIEPLSKEVIESMAEEISDETLEESVGAVLAGDLLPRKALHFLKRVLHRNHYKVALKIARDIVKNPHRKETPSQALVIAAQTVGLDPKELMKVIDKRTRNK